MEALSSIPDASVEDIDRFPAALGLAYRGRCFGVFSPKFRSLGGCSHFQRVADLNAGCIERDAVAQPRSLGPGLSE